jgi:restriction endonuclease Mrr
MMRVLIIVVLLGIVGLAGFSWIMIRWSYATGERAGFVQRLSRRGYICKTWEGEMAMVTMPGTISEKFLFTVPDDATAAKINASLGKRVSVHYEQHKWIPNSCIGETEFYVTNVQVME